MIDYLERLFVREEPGLEGEEDSVSPSPLGNGESMERMPVPRFRDEEQWQQEAVQRLERALTVPGSPVYRLSEEPGEGLRMVRSAREEPVFEAYPSPAAYPYREEERAETLEHRLRRDSRRYDSGFFLY